jgi:hypothetical protein
MRFTHLLSALFVITLFLAFNGCTPHSDPMKGWKELGRLSNTAAPETITKDAQTFIQTLPATEKVASGEDYNVTYWEDVIGQHAVVLNTPHDGEHWHYALIYDQNNRRIKVIKYSTGSYMS